MARWKDVQWNLHGTESQTTVPNDQIKMALLMDVRDELKRLNSIIGCSNFIAIPRTLTRIARNTTKKRRKK